MRLVGLIAVVDRQVVTRDAVILAAGKGTRLRQSENDVPKPLFVVGGKPLITRTVSALADGGISRVVVVTGFMAPAIESALVSDEIAKRVTIDFVHNPDFDKSNGVSVIAGGRACDGPFVLSMADHIYPKSVVELLRAQEMTAADLWLATDPRINEVLDIDDATKVRTENARIMEIGKTIATYDRIDCGVFCVTQGLVKVLDEIRTERGDCSLSNGVQRLAELGRARVVDIGDVWWQDVDTQADRAHAEEQLRRRP